jgi:hypothetical protein
MNYPRRSIKEQKNEKKKNILDTKNDVLLPSPVRALYSVVVAQTE